MKVLIPKIIFNPETLYLVSVLFQTIYNKDTELNLLVTDDKITEYLVINVDESRGKQIAIEYAQNLLLEYCYFIKNGYLYKKWTDTGIVDKLGLIEQVDNEIRLKGV